MNKNLEIDFLTEELAKTDGRIAELEEKYLKAGEKAENLRDENTVLKHRVAELEKALRELQKEMRRREDYIESCLV
jgi:chromosome segregation ATPase